MPVMCPSRDAICAQALLLAWLATCIDAGSCPLPAKPPDASALLQRHHRRGGQPVPETELQESLLVKGTENLNAKLRPALESNIRSQPAGPLQAFGHTLVGYPQAWVAPQNGTTDSLANAFDLGLGAAVVGEPASVPQEVQWQQGTSMARLSKPVSIGFKSGQQPWGRVADEDSVASAEAILDADNITAISVTSSAADAQNSLLASSTSGNLSGSSVATLGADVNDSQIVEAIVVNSTIVSKNASLTEDDGNTKLAADIAVTNTRLGAAAVPSAPIQNSLVVATKDVVQKGRKDSKDVEAGDSKSKVDDEDAKSKGKKAKKEDKAKDDKAKDDKAKDDKAKDDKAKGDAQGNKEESNEDSSPASSPAKQMTVEGTVNAILAYFARMTALDFVGFGGSAVVMFLFLVLADII